jgi:hypothetical protein
VKYVNKCEHLKNATRVGPSLTVKEYDHLFVIIMANYPCGPNIDHQLKRFAHSVILRYPLQRKRPVFTICYLGSDAIRCNRN